MVSSQAGSGLTYWDTVRLSKEALARLGSLGEERDVRIEALVGKVEGDGHW